MEQTKRWQDVTTAVHAKGAIISCQLLHAGRVAQPGIAHHPIAADAAHLPPVSASPVHIPMSDDVDNEYAWDKPAARPRALRPDEIPRLLDD